MSPLLQTYKWFAAVSEIPSTRETIVQISPRHEMNRDKIFTRHKSQKKYYALKIATRLFTKTLTIIREGRRKWSEMWHVIGAFKACDDDHALAARTSRSDALTTSLRGIWQLGVRTTREWALQLDQKGGWIVLVLVWVGGWVNEGVGGWLNEWVGRCWRGLGV